MIGYGPNSAKRAADLYNEGKKEAEKKAKHQAKLEAGADASIAQKEMMAIQIEELKEQNRLLSENYERLTDMYNHQKETTEELRNDLKKSRKFNAWMMVIAVVSMFAAIAGPIVTLAVRG